MSEEIRQFDQADIEANKVLAILMIIFPILFFLVFVVDSMQTRHLSCLSSALFLSELLRLLFSFASSFSLLEFSMVHTCLFLSSEKSSLSSSNLI